MKRIILLFFVTCMLTSCGAVYESTNGGIFYKGQVIKTTGERKTKYFMFRSSCERKSARVAKKRRRMRNPERNQNYGITTTGNAKQRR